MGRVYTSPMVVGKGVQLGSFVCTNSGSEWEEEVRRGLRSYSKTMDSMEHMFARD